MRYGISCVTHKAHPFTSGSTGNSSAGKERLRRARLLHKLTVSAAARQRRRFARFDRTALSIRLALTSAVGTRGRADSCTRSRNRLVPLGGAIRFTLLARPRRLSISRRFERATLRSCGSARRRDASPSSSVHSCRRDRQLRDTISVILLPPSPLARNKKSQRRCHSTLLETVSVPDCSFRRGKLSGDSAPCAYRSKGSRIHDLALS